MDQASFPAHPERDEAPEILVACEFGGDVC
jgi:hypothetical protein